MDSSRALRGFARTGLGERRDYEEVVSEMKLRASRKKENRNLIASLREESHSGTLLEHCRKDYHEGRMECPRLAHECDLTAITLAPRFAVEQGELGSLDVFLLQVLAWLCFCRSEARWHGESETRRRYVEVLLLS